MDASNDGSESVDQFLARIASLSSKQGQEEAERSRRAEEEMLQARKERQARRAGMIPFWLLDRCQGLGLTHDIQNVLDPFHPPKPVRFHRYDNLAMAHPPGVEVSSLQLL